MFEESFNRKKTSHPRIPGMGPVLSKSKVNNARFKSAESLAIVKGPAVTF